MRVRIKLRGCDDSTEIVKDVTPEQWVFLQDVADELTAEAGYHCQPEMEVSEVAVEPVDA